MNVDFDKFKKFLLTKKIVDVRNDSDEWMIASEDGEEMTVQSDSLYNDVQVFIKPIMYKFHTNNSYVIEGKGTVYIIDPVGYKVDKDLIMKNGVNINNIHYYVKGIELFAIARNPSNIIYGNEPMGILVK